MKSVLGMKAVHLNYAFEFDNEGSECDSIHEKTTNSTCSSCSENGEDSIYCAGANVSTRISLVMNISHIYSELGEYTVTVTVLDPFREQTFTATHSISNSNCAQPRLSISEYNNDIHCLTDLPTNQLTC